MSYFKFILIAIVVINPGVVFADSIFDNFLAKYKANDFYLGLVYKPTLENFGNIEVISPEGSEIGGFIHSNKSNLVISELKNGELHILDGVGKEKNLITYKPIYETGLSGGVLLGYETDNNIRMELEGSYLEFKLDYTKFSVKEIAEHVIVSNDDSLTLEHRKYIDFKNYGYKSGLMMFNVYRDIESKGSIPFAMYIGAGVGLDIINIFDATKYGLSYQGKAGFSYILSPQIKKAYKNKVGTFYAMFPQITLFGGGFYHAVLGDKFVVHNITNIGGFSDGANEVILKMPCSNFGVEFGIRFTFG